MNIFKKHSDILGNVDAKHLENTLYDFFEIASEIKTFLGERGYLLDKYISYLLETANHKLCHAAANNGFDLGDTHKLCQEIMNDKESNKDHPLHGKIVDVLTGHLLSYQEKCTRLNILLIAISDQNFEQLSRDYYSNMHSSALGILDIVHLRQLYKQIAEFLGGEEKMEKLNFLFRQRFLIVPPMLAFAQAHTNKLLYCLTSRDMETSRQVFQIILDNPQKFLYK